jgi:hypothetical protein
MLIFAMSQSPRAAHRSVLAAAAILALAGSLPSPAPACSVPVFRYAMERWPPEPYEATVFHRGPLSAADEAIAKHLEAGFGPFDPSRPKVPTAPPNLLLTRVDVGAPLNDLQKKIWEAQKDAPLPRVVIRYPNAEAGEPALWAGPLSAESVRLAIDSPARREVARRLLAGEAAVWILLESGDKTKDGAAAALLAEQFRWAEKELELPKPDPMEEDGDGPAPGPGFLRSAVPLRLAFSLLRISRGDAAEKVFIDMLKRGAETPPPDDQPVTFPIFGRGRVLDALHGKHFKAEVIREVAGFLTGPCSCQVKDMNPGMDLLISADWESFLEGPAAKPAGVAPAGTATAPPVPLRAPAPGSPLLSSVLIVIGVAGLLALAAITAYILSRPPKNRT